MTVMSSNTRELDINTLVLMAYQYAGVMNELQTAQGPQWDARSTYGRRHLEVIIDALGAEGIFERSMEAYDVTVVAGAESTELPADTIDVRSAMMQNDDSNLTEYRLDPLSRESYASLTTKAQEGPPRQFYVARTSPMRLFLWPIPDAACVVTLQRQRLTFDNSAGASTTDLERYWMDYLVNELAARVALTNGMPMDRVMALQAKATAAQTKARGKSSSQLPNQIVVNHRGPYRR